MTLYAKWQIIPVGGSGDFDLKGPWNIGINSNIITDLAFTNAGATVQADFPDVVYSYDNTADTAILFWRLTNRFAKIRWTTTACGGFDVHHSQEAANLSDLAAASDSLDYYLVPEYSTAPSISESDPAEGAAIPKSTTSMTFTFSHLMGSHVSCTPSGAVVASPPTTAWTHDFATGQSTLTLGNVVFSGTIGSVSIEFFPTMKDCNGNDLAGNRIITFTTTD